jgi:hypothetical protein
MTTTKIAQGFSGRCLCGAVSFQSNADPQAVMHCCCEDCRKSSGTGHCTHIVIPKNAFDVTGDVTRFSHLGGSGNTVTKAFCGTCGSPVYSTNSGYPETVFPRASILDDPERVQPQMVVFAKSAISWDKQDEALPAFDEGPS